MSGGDPLERAIADWQRKHRIADDDPMIAALELVRIHLQHTRQIGADPNATPPSFEDFRGTIELLERGSKSFINQASDLIAELRRFGQNVERLNRARAATCVMLIVIATIIGLFIGRSL